MTVLSLDTLAAEKAEALTRAQREALALIARRQLYRVTGGWKVPGGRKLSGGTVINLKIARLVAERPQSWSVTLAPTDLGKRVLAVIQGETS